MSHEANTIGVRIRRFALRIVQRILPVAVRDLCMTELSDLCRPVGDWFRQIPGTVMGAYRNQVVLAFDVVTWALQAAGTAYCFSASGLGAPVGVLLGSVMGTLVLRSAYTYPFDRYGKAYRPANPWQNALDSGTDSVMSVVAVLFCQSVMVETSSLALPESRMWHGIILFTPLMFVLRVVFRPRPDPTMPFRGSNLTSDQIFKRTWGLNILWIFTCHWTMATNPHSIPDWVPAAGFLRGFLPFQVFIVWFRIQANPLTRRDHIETLLTDWKKKKKARHREILMKGMNKNEPYYWAYVGLQWVLFAYLSTPILFALWPWLAGTETNLDVFGIAFHVAALITLALTWDYLKAANRVAAAALQDDIGASGTALAYC